MGELRPDESQPPALDATGRDHIARLPTTSDCRRNALPQSVNRQTMALLDPGIRGMSDQSCRGAKTRGKYEAASLYCLLRYGGDHSSPIAHRTITYGSSGVPIFYSAASESSAVLAGFD